MNYNLADFVRFPRSGVTGFTIARIEDFNLEEDWFEYFVHLTPEELPTGRQSHHAQNEVFKTDQLRRGSYQLIHSKVTLLKLRDYMQSDRTSFLMRQEFRNGELLPSLKTCACGGLPNPDYNAVICPDCEKLFHAECRLQNCDQCRAILPQVKVTRQQDPPKLIQQAPPASTVIEVEEEDEEIMLSNANSKKIDLEKLVKKFKKNDGGAHKTATIVIVDDNHKQQPKPQAPQKPQETKRTSTSQPFKNLTPEQIRRMEQWVERFHLQEQNLSSFERKRQEVREKLFKVIFYGVEELKAQETLTPPERDFIQQPAEQLYHAIKNLALEIEVLFHLKFNTQNRDRLDPAYIDRCKLIYMHMKDEKNLELRRKVISKEFLPTDLCTRDERDFYNPERRKETMQIQMRTIELYQKDLEPVPKPEFDDVSFSRQLSINEETPAPQVLQQQHSVGNNNNANNSNSKKESQHKLQQLMEKFADFSQEKFQQRFRKRILDELSEKEQRILLQNLDALQ